MTITNLLLESNEFEVALRNESMTTISLLNNSPTDHPTISMIRSSPNVTSAVLSELNEYIARYLPGNERPPSSSLRHSHLHHHQLQTEHSASHPLVKISNLRLKSVLDGSSALSSLARPLPKDQLNQLTNPDHMNSPTYYSSLKFEINIIVITD